MTTIPEQLTAAGRDQFLAQLEFFGSLTSAALDNTRRLADMQLRASRATFNRSADAVRQLIDVRDAGGLPGGFSTAGIENMFQFGREIMSIMTGVTMAPQPGGTWPAGQAEAGRPPQTGTTQPEVKDAPRASQADAGQGPDTGTTQPQPESKPEETRAGTPSASRAQDAGGPAHAQTPQADDSGSAIPPAAAAQLGDLADAPAVQLPPAGDSALTPVADAAARAAGKKPAPKK